MQEACGPVKVAQRMNVHICMVRKGVARREVRYGFCVPEMTKYINTVEVPPTPEVGMW